MNGEFTVFDTLDKVAVGEIRTRLRDILGAFLFHGEDIDKKVKVLSGGERSRLAMARMMLEPRNLLVLDEPTNHMDMRSKDILKNALKKYDGTLILVSHDRDFLDGIVDKVYEFRDGGVKEYLGGIYYFLEKRKLESLREVEIKQKEVAAEPVAASKGKEEYLQRIENEKEIRRIKNAITKVESEIERLEGEIAEWDAKLAAPEAHGLDISNPALFDSYNQLKQQLDHQMHEWEKLNYELDIVTN
jgi:ATP-binding cassette subfamily F protein 3